MLGNRRVAKEGEREMTNWLIVIGGIGGAITWWYRLYHSKKLEKDKANLSKAAKEAYAAIAISEREGTNMFIAFLTAICLILLALGVYIQQPSPPSQPQLGVGPVQICQAGWIECMPTSDIEGKAHMGRGDYTFCGYAEAEGFSKIKNVSLTCLEQEK